MTANSISLQLPRRSAWVTVFGVSLMTMLLFAALLVSLRLEKALSDLLEDRAVLMARQLADAIEGGLRFGIPLSDQTEIPRKMTALSEHDAELKAMALVDDASRPVVQHVATSTPETLDPRTAQRLLSKKVMVTSDAARKVWHDGAGIQVLMQVRDATGSVSGAVWVLYSARTPRQAFFDSMVTLSTWAVGLTCAVTLLVALGVGVVSRRSDGVLDSLAADADPALPPWPLLPLPQAMHTLSELEKELDSLSTDPAAKVAT